MLDIEVVQREGQWRCEVDITGGWPQKAIDSAFASKEEAILFAKGLGRRRNVGRGGRDR